MSFSVLGSQLASCEKRELKIWNTKDYTLGKVFNYRTKKNELSTPQRANITWLINWDQKK